MTCREKLKLEHPNCVGDPNTFGFEGGCLDCPDDYGYLETPDYCGEGNNKITCANCWDREIPGTEGIHVEMINLKDIVKKETKTMEKKTKAQLIEEIRAMQKELENLDKYRKYEDAANELYAIYESFKNAGFTRDQAWELFMTSMKMAQPIRG